MISPVCVFRAPLDGKGRGAPGAPPALGLAPQLAARARGPATGATLPRGPARGQGVLRTKTSSTQIRRSYLRRVVVVRGRVVVVRGVCASFYQVFVRSLVPVPARLEDRAERRPGLPQYAVRTVRPRWVRVASTVRGALGASCPAPPVRTQRGRLVRVVRTYPTEAPRRACQLRLRAVCCARASTRSCSRS